MESTTKYFIQLRYWDPCSHSMEWVIVGDNGNDWCEVYGEESAILFDTVEEARLYVKKYNLDRNNSVHILKTDCN